MNLILRLLHLIENIKNIKALTMRDTDREVDLIDVKKIENKK